MLKASEARELSEKGYKKVLNSFLDQKKIEIENEIRKMVSLGWVSTNIDLPLTVKDALVDWLVSLGYSVIINFDRNGGLRNYNIGW